VASPRGADLLEGIFLSRDSDRPGSPPEASAWRIALTTGGHRAFLSIDVSGKTIVEASHE